MSISAEEFKKSGYVVVRNMIDLQEAARLYDYTLEIYPRGDMKDGQVPGSPSFYQDKEMVALHDKILPKTEEVLQSKLFSTFCYHRTYRTGAVLRMHKDRKACEIAISMNLGQKGEVWDLWIMDADENAHQLILNPGDAVIYRGCKLRHWRGKLVNADLVSQAFFFFVDGKSWRRIALKTELFHRLVARCRKLLGYTY